MLQDATNYPAVNTAPSPAQATTAPHMAASAPVRPVNVVAELQENDIAGVEQATSIMSGFLKAVLERLKLETSSKTAAQSDKWLLSMLKLNSSNWTLHASCAKIVCEKLCITYNEPAYYRDIFVWLPELRWGKEAMPPCPHCRVSNFVSPHGFRDNNDARRVCNMKNHYFVVSRRYICHTCESVALAKKASYVALAEHAGLRVKPCADIEEKTQYTFMGWDSISMSMLPFGYGSHYPAFHSHRSGVDNSILNLMRPLFNKGLRPDALSHILLELHTKEYTDKFIEREFLIKRDSRLLSTVAKERGQFSSFGDKDKYAGLVPTGEYLADVYLKYGDSIKVHLDNDVKKRGAEVLSWDASYKEANHLCQYHGKKMFDVLLTATNEVGEIRIQFHAGTDAHDQYVNPIQWFLETARAYNLCEPKLLFTDNPSHDKKFFLENMPSLAATMLQLKTLAPNSVLDPNELPTCQLLPDLIKVLSGATQINTFCDAIRDVILARPQKMRILSLDTEWEVGKNSQGMVTHSFPVSIIQLGYRNDQNTSCAVIFQVSTLKKVLPTRLVHLLQDPLITYVGRQVGGDVSKLEKDFNLNLSKVVTAELGKMARTRGCVGTGTTSLAALVKVVLKEELRKNELIRCGSWSSPKLSDEQKQYAALDVTKALDLYFELLKMPDFSSRLSIDEILAGTVVDIVPSHGSVQVMATRAATGRVAEHGTKWNNPLPNGTPVFVNGNSTTRKTAIITEVYAPNAVIPGLKSNGQPVSFKNFGAPPFSVSLPIVMYAHHFITAPRFSVASTPESPWSVVKPNATLTRMPWSSINPNAAGMPTKPTAKAKATEQVLSPLPEQVQSCPSITPTSVTPIAVNKNSAPIIACSSTVPVPNVFNDSGCASNPNVSACPAMPLSNVTAAVDRQNEGSASDILEDSEYTSGPEDERGWEQAERLLEVTIAEVETMRKAAALYSHHTTLHPELSTPPALIVDIYSSVLADVFHLMDRPKVPVHHAAKKCYFVALRNAYFMWDPIKLEAVKVALRGDGLSDDDIEAKMYYDVDYFRRRVPRIVLPPSALYGRVRAVFFVYGSIKDPVTQACLFNKAAWSKANNVLLEILAGNASDPPGFSFYSQQLDSKGKPAFDKHGIALLNCSRGTNATECVHKQITQLFSSWNFGVAFSDAVLGEHRHRYNMHVSERRRPGFPILGHCDTWKIDTLQILVSENHGAQLYPEWSNSTDHLDTPERFGTVPLQSAALHAAIEAINVDPLNCNLSRDMLYLCKMMGTKLPLLPVHGHEEFKAFRDMIIDPDVDALDFEVMSVKWCQKVDGIHIFPKLPVHLRKYHAEYLRNNRIKDVVKNAASGEAKLQEINDATQKDFMAVHFAPPISLRSGVALQPATQDHQMLVPSLGALTTEAVVQSNGQPTLEKQRQFLVVQQHRPLSQVAPISPNRSLTCTGGTIIGGAPPPELSDSRSSKRQRRCCQVCKDLRNNEEYTCAGAGGRKFCKFVTASLSDTT